MLAVVALALTLVGLPFVLVGGPLLGTPLAVLVLAALGWRLVTGPALTVASAAALSVAAVACLVPLTIYVVHPLHPG